MRGRAVALPLLLILGAVGTQVAQAQQVDILLEGGHVIDPRNGLDAQLDVAIGGGRILQVARNIPTQGAPSVVDATGLYVTPGILDIHCHLASGAGGDGCTFRAGVTTCVDAGSYGWRNFQLAEDQINALRTPWFVFLAIAGDKVSREGGHGNILVQDYSDGFILPDITELYPSP